MSGKSAQQELAGQTLIPGVAPVQSLALDERYTTRETLAWCAAKAGVEAFDTDVAACDEAHCAPEWMDIAVNGLRWPWQGRVWCNPPYSDIAPWVSKAWTEIGRHQGPDVIAMLLPATRTEQPWWQEMVEPYRDRAQSGLRVHFVPGRVSFGNPGNPQGIGVGSPPFGCCLLVWRSREP